MIRPVFLLSLPRSGSTLLQRLIATHPAVATASEPWLLLPLFLAYREGDVTASYDQRLLRRAHRDFLRGLDRGAEAHQAAVRGFADSMYRAACRPGQTHFLDKTPRYHLIAEDLLLTFPDASFVLLWRNPLAVIASMLELHGGRWVLREHRLDLFRGLDNLIELRRRYSDRLLELRYEDLVEDPDRHLARLFAALGLAPLDHPSSRLAESTLRGRLGDKKGRDLPAVSRRSRDLWPKYFDTLPRRAWARRYLNWIGSERLRMAGYDPDELSARLSAPPMRWHRGWLDLLRMSRDRLFSAAGDTRLGPGQDAWSQTPDGHARGGREESEYPG